MSYADQHIRIQADDWEKALRGELLLTAAGGVLAPLEPDAELRWCFDHRVVLPRGKCPWGEDCDVAKALLFRAPEDAP